MKLTQQEINIDLFDEVKRLKKQNRIMRDAMTTFVNRVEKGEIRSKKTYAQFKNILKG